MNKIYRMFFVQIWMRNFGLEMRLQMLQELFTLADATHLKDPFLLHSHLK